MNSQEFNLFNECLKIFFFQKRTRFKRDHNSRQTNQKDQLHDLFIRQTFTSSPQNLREIAKIVLPKRKVLPLPEGAKMLLKEYATPTLDPEEAADDDNVEEKDDDEIGAAQNNDGEIMSLFDALNEIQNYEDDVVLVTPDHGAEPINE